MNLAKRHRRNKMDEDKDNKPTSPQEAAPSLEYQYATTTTLHGIGRLADAPGAWRKLPWVLVLLIAGGFYMYVTIDRVQDYLKFEANTNVNITFHESLEFPAVTVCNYNRYMNSKIRNSEKKYVKHLLKVSAEFDDYDDDDSEDFDLSSLDDIFSDDFNYTAFAINTGYSLSESMLECTWKSESSICNASAFTPYYSPTYGQCFTFNLGKQRPRRKQTRQGIGSGLRLILDIKQHEYTETYASGNYEAGIKFAIHNQDELPLLDTLGLSAPPGYHTYTSMRMVRHKNLVKPWGVCGTDGIQDPVTYSRNTCLRNCNRDVIIKRCGCLPLGYYIEGKDFVPYCNLTKFVCVHAALEARRLSPASQESCSCPVSCDYTTYETTLSMAAYPSESVSVAAVNDLRAKMTPNESGTIHVLNEDYAKRNLVYLEVYFNELSSITYRQVEATPLTALLGDLGGQLGLFLGASIITGVELIDYIMRRLKTFTVKVKARRQVDPGKI